MPKSQVINDLLAVPSLEDRSKLLSDPNINNLVEQALSFDPNYVNAPDSAKAEIRAQLGFPKPIIPPTGVQIPEQEFTQHPLAPMAQELQKFGPPSPRQLIEAELQRTETGAAQRLQQPITAENLPSILTGLLQQNVKAPIIRNFYLDNPQSIGAQVARGVIAGTPGLAAARPQFAQDPRFLSVENAAMIATDMLMTLPVFRVAKAADAYKFFIRYPGVSRAVGEAMFLGGADAGYRAFVKGSTELIRDGKTSLPRLATEIPGDFANAMGMMLGFGGAMAALSSGKRALLRQTVSEFDRPAGQGITEALSGMKGTAAVTSDVRSAMRRPIPRPDETSMSEAYFVRGHGPEPEGYTPPKTMYPGGRVGMIDDPYYVGGERPFTPDPIEMQVVDDVLGGQRVKIYPDGSQDFTVTEPVIRTMFVTPERANAGDHIYHLGGGDQRLLKVVKKLEDGLIVDNGKRQYFVKYERLTSVKQPYEIGSEVYSAMGEPLIVRGYTANNAVWAQSRDGHMSIFPQDRLQTPDTAISAGESAERTAAGIDTPAPDGWSVMDLMVLGASAGLAYAADSDDEAAAMAMIPGILLGGKWSRRRRAHLDAIAAGKVIPIGVSTQPGGKDFGAYRYYTDPHYTLGMLNMPQYDLGAQMLLASKVMETQLNANAITMLTNFRKQVGTHKDVSEKLTRFLVGVPKPGEVLTPQERAVVDNFRQWGNTELIPAINARRAMYRQAPLPPSYNWPLQLFPEMLLNHGYSSGGLTPALGRAITPQGVDNLVSIGGASARLHLTSNFWELADSALKMHSHEKSYRQTIEYLRQTAMADPSSTNKKYLNWLVNHLEGRQISPSMSDITEFANNMDAWTVNHFGSKQGAKLEIINGAPITQNGKIIAQLPSGKTIEFESPLFSFADKDLAGAAMSMKKLSYANTIGLNMRLIPLNLTQPLTHVAPQLPGSMIRNTIDLLEGYVKSVAPLVSKNAREYYRQRGVLHDIEEIFSAPNVTAVTSGPVLSASYMKDWLLHKIMAVTFLNMRATEIINRVTAYEATRSSFNRASRGTKWEALAQAPDFQKAIDSLATNMTNIGNFLYGKGFKSPLQESLGINLDAGRRGGAASRFLGAPLGELLYQFNTFSAKTVGVQRLLWNQMRKDHPSLVSRISKFNNPQEFADFLDSLKEQQRYAFLRWWVFGIGTAGMVSATTGLHGMFAQIVMPNLAATNPVTLFMSGLTTPVVQGLAKMVQEFGQLDAGGLIEAGQRHFAPAPLKGSTARERYERGGGLMDSLFSIRSEVEGTKSPFTPEWMNAMTPGAP